MSSNTTTPISPHAVTEIDFSTVRLRPGTSSDEVVHAVVALGRKVFFDTFAHTVSQESMDSYLDSSYSYDPIKKDLTNPRRRCILAEADDAKTGKPFLVGYSFLDTDSTEECLKDWPNAIELLRIYAHPLAHGKGVARRLADASFELGRREGFENIWLGVFPENHRAIGFYTKLGFKKVGTHSFWVGDQEDTDDVMARSLKD
ncbi:hypothetical protein V8E36_003083 [Tilletia maclaganii]